MQDNIGSSLEATISSISINLTIFASIFVVVVIAIAAIMKNETERQKLLMFWSIAVVSVLTTIALIGMTLYLNFTSYTKGPVHWHAGIEFFECGERIDLINPTGWSNKVGTPSLHEHNDHWIHLEGVPVEPVDASIGKFLKAVNVTLEDDLLTVPTDSGNHTVKNGDLCNGQPGKVQTFIITADKQAKTYSKRKVTTQELLDHVIRAEANIPPGDCYIIEFDLLQEKTDKICEQYFRAEQRGEIREAD